MIKTQYKPYDKYSPSGIEWIGEIPEEWEGKRFCFLFSFNKGLSITKEDLLEEGIPCVSYGEIHSRYGFEVNPSKHELKYVKVDYLQSNPSSLLKNGDFIFADTSEDIEGSGNFTYLNSQDSAFAGYHTIIAKPKSVFYHRYIAYLFDSLSFRTQIRSEVAGIKVYSITKTILKDTFVLLPPLPEQKAIAAFLDRETERINGIIAKQTRMIELLKEKRSALITQAVTKGLDPKIKMKPSGVEWIGDIPEEWEMRRWRFVAKCNPSKSENKFDGNLEVQFVPMELVSDESSSLTLTETRPAYEVSNGYTYFLNGDVLIAKITPCFENGKGALAAGLMNGIGFGTTELHVYRADGKIINNKYLFLISKLNAFRSLGEASMKGAAGQKRITDLFVKDFIIPLPPLPGQKAIASFLDRETGKIDKMISKIEKQIELLNEYKQSLITHAVTGKIDVRGEVNAQNS